MSYDVKSWELAEHFGHNTLTDAEIINLAQHIQDMVESEVEYLISARKDQHGTPHDAR